MWHFEYIIGQIIKIVSCSDNAFDILSDNVGEVIHQEKSYYTEECSLTCSVQKHGNEWLIGDGAIIDR